MRGLPRTLARAGFLYGGKAPSVAGLKAVTKGAAGQYEATFTIDGMQVEVPDADAYASQKIFDFAPGKIRMLGGTASLAFAVLTVRADTINDSAAMDWSLGSAAASATSLSSTMVDFIAKQDKTLDGTDADYTTAQVAAFASSATFDGTSSPIDLYLNVSFPTGTDIDADGTLAVKGKITLLFENWGGV